LFVYFSLGLTALIPMGMSKRKMQKQGPWALLFCFASALRKALPFVRRRKTKKATLRVAFCAYCDPAGTNLIAFIFTHFPTCPINTAFIGFTGHIFKEDKSN